MILLHNISQLLTLSGGPQRGHALGNLSIMPDAAVLIDGEHITAVGSSADLLNAYPSAELFDAHGCVVMPGFVDPHTHLVWAGDRAAEFELRLQGKTYMEIMAAGGASSPPSKPPVLPAWSSLSSNHTNAPCRLLIMAPPPWKPKPVTA